MTQLVLLNPQLVDNPAQTCAMAAGQTLCKGASAPLIRFPCVRSVHETQISDAAAAAAAARCDARSAARRKGSRLLGQKVFTAPAWELPQDSACAGNT